MNVAFHDNPTRAGLPFTGPWLLAPMEGVTDPAFRELVLALHDARELGGAFTEFVRVVGTNPVKGAVMRRYLGGRRHSQPVGIQLMGSDAGAVAASAAQAAELGVPLVDLNFGCPAKGALRGCAGSAVLDDPRRLEQLVCAATDGVDGRVPVTAKIRAGGNDAEHVEELARAAEAGGASMLTIHCRTRIERYQDGVDWTRIARAVSSVSIPVCGNGGVSTHSDLERMRRETGCTFVMVGRAVLGDPWIFSGHIASRGETARFVLDYANALRSRSPNLKGAASRMKQLLRCLDAGRFVRDEDDRRTWLTERDARRLFARLDAEATS